MEYIAVHSALFGPKLTELYQTLNCSKFEAIGVLVALWTWGKRNARRDGFLPHVGKGDIAMYLYSQAAGSKISPPDAVDALIDTGWIDETEHGLLIHDWYAWQECVYKITDRLESDANRKREERKRAADRKQASSARQTDHPGLEEPAKKEPEPALPHPSPEKPEKPEKPKQSKRPEPPEKIKYSDFVKMKAKEYETLCAKYGKPFVKECINTLDYYKGAKGKQYKDDYRAILSWVVDRVQEKRPGLMNSSMETIEKKHDAGNPFASFMEDF